jgi:hypothetical protein
VPEYRVYEVDEFDHIRAPAKIIQCADDREARNRVRRMLGRHTLEVWTKDRRVAVLKPTDREKDD